MNLLDDPLLAIIYEKLGIHPESVTESTRKTLLRLVEKIEFANLKESLVDDFNMYINAISDDDVFGICGSDISKKNRSNTFYKQNVGLKILLNKLRKGETFLQSNMSLPKKVNNQVKRQPLDGQEKETNPNKSVLISDDEYQSTNEKEEILSDGDCVDEPREKGTPDQPTPVIKKISNMYNNEIYRHNYKSSTV